MGLINKLFQSYSYLLFISCLIGIAGSFLDTVYARKVQGKKYYLNTNMLFFFLGLAIYIISTYSGEIKSSFNLKDLVFLCALALLVFIGIIFMGKLRKKEERIIHEYKGFTNILFYPATISKDWLEKEDYEEQRQYELAITLNKKEFEIYYINYYQTIGISGYLVDVENQNVHFITHLDVNGLNKLLRIKSPLSNNIKEQTERWSNTTPGRIIDHYIIEYIGSIEYYSDYM